MKHVFVNHLPDLMRSEDYQAPQESPKVRIRIGASEQGLEILGDSLDAPLVEALLAHLGATSVDRTLCG
jgi:hypothetical protein